MHIPKEVVCRLIVQPVLWLSKRWHSAHGSRALHQRLLEAKERALRQKELISAAAARMAAQEEAQHGLIIVRVRALLTSFYQNHQDIELGCSSSSCLMKSFKGTSEIEVALIFTRSQVGK